MSFRLGRRRAATKSVVKSGIGAFVVMWAGQLVSLLGSSMTRFAVGIWVFEETGLAAAFTTMLFFSHIPRILLGPFSGALVDRFSRKALLILSDLGTALTTIAVFLLVGSSSLEIWHLYGLVTVSSAFESVQFPAHSAAITMLVDKRQYARTAAMQSFADDGARLLAPILATIVVVSSGLQAVLFIDILTFGVAIVTLAIIAIPRPPRSAAGRASRGNIWYEASYGFRFILGNRSLLGLQLNFLMVNLVLGMSTGLRVPMILARSGNDELLLGKATSIALAGGMVGGAIMAIWGGPSRRINAVLSGIIGLALSLAVLGLARDLVGWALGGFLVFLFIPVANAANQAIWQSKTPPDVQGKVFAARRVTGQITFPLALLLTGPLADRVFEPAMEPGGHLAGTFGDLLGTGPGAGMSLVMLLVAALGLIMPVASLFVPVIRNVEDLVPDADASN